MNSDFWTQLKLCLRDDDWKNNSIDSFVSNYHIISRLVHDKMYSREVADMFCEIVESADGHDDLCDFIIWNGKQATTDFLADPKSAIPLAEIMSHNPGFDGPINSLRRIVYY